MTVEAVLADHPRPARDNMLAARGFAADDPTAAMMSGGKSEAKLTASCNASNARGWRFAL
jgi:hypothetical protein